MPTSTRHLKYLLHVIKEKEVFVERQIGCLDCGGPLRRHGFASLLCCSWMIFRAYLFVKPPILVFTSRTVENTCPVALFSRRLRTNLWNSLYTELVKSVSAMILVYLIKHNGCHDAQVFVFVSNSECFLELLCRADIPSRGIAPLDQLVLRKGRCHKKQRNLSYMKLPFFGNTNKCFLRKYTTYSAYRKIQRTVQSHRERSVSSRTWCLSLLEVKTRIVKHRIEIMLYDKMGKQKSTG